jgi:hypothetical protein
VRCNGTTGEICCSTRRIVVLYGTVAAAGDGARTGGSGSGALPPRACAAAHYTRIASHPPLLQTSKAGNCRSGKLEPFTACLAALPPGDRVHIISQVIRHLLSESGIVSV